MEVIQLIIIVFALFAFSRAVLRSRDRAISRSAFIFWSVVWISVIVVAFIPGITSFFAFSLGIGRGIDFVVYLSVILLFYLLFRLYIHLDNTNKALTKVVREISFINLRRRK